MRAAESINSLTFLFLVAVAWGQRLPPRRRAKANAIGAAGLTITALSAFVVPRVLAPLPASVVRDWLPYILLLMIYWQAGQFFIRVDANFQRKLQQLDYEIVDPLLVWCTRHRAGRRILTALEVAYLFCYPLLPLGLAALYLMRMGRQADYFWSVVLLSTYACYGMLPFLQTQPPRKTQEAARVPLPATSMRSLNLWVLRHASIQANTFPSAHVASSTACSLVLLHLAPGVGLCFLLVAFCIALGAVAGRYHYALDAMVAAVVAIAIFLAVPPL